MSRKSTKDFWHHSLLFMLFFLISGLVALNFNSKKNEETYLTNEGSNNYIIIENPELVDTLFLNNIRSLQEKDSVLAFKLKKAFEEVSSISNLNDSYRRYIERSSDKEKTGKVVKQKGKKANTDASYYKKNLSDAEVDSLLVESILLIQLKKNITPSFVAGTSYFAYKELNKMTPKYLKETLKSHGVGKKYINRVPKKFNSKWIKMISKSKRATIIAIGGSAAYVVAQEFQDSESESNIVIVTICGALFFYHLYVYLSKVGILED